MNGSIRKSGQTACMTIEGAVNAEVFRAHVREVLQPTLSPGDFLIMGNLSAHKDGQALEMFREAGVMVRFLPTLSPDYNPIELMWSKVKALLRKAEAPHG
jgi:transposase